MTNLGAYLLGVATLPAVAVVLWLFAPIALSIYNALGRPFIHVRRPSTNPIVVSVGFSRHRVVWRERNYCWPCRRWIALDANDPQERWRPDKWFPETRATRFRRHERAHMRITYRRQAKEDQ